MIEIYSGENLHFKGLRMKLKSFVRKKDFVKFQNWKDWSLFLWRMVSGAFE